MHRTHFFAAAAAAITVAGSLVAGVWAQPATAEDDKAAGFGEVASGGFRLEVKEQDELPADAAFRSEFSEKMIDLGTDAEGKGGRTWEIWVKCASATTPDAKTPAEMGWIVLPEERVGFLRAAARTDTSSKKGTTTGFRIAFHRPPMTEAARKAAEARGRNIRVLSVDVREPKATGNGPGTGAKAVQDPSPVVISKVGAAYLAGDEDVFLYARPVHPDSKEGQEAARAEDGTKAKGPRPYRAALRLGPALELQPGGTFAPPAASAAPQGDAPPAAR